MIRRTCAGFLTVVLVPAALAAQTTLTIETMSADVYESRTAAARVIGLASRGRVLEVTREDGDWATVVWPDARAGVGYVRLRIGSLARTDRKAQPSMRDVRADVNAVEQAVLRLWEVHPRSTTMPHEQPAR